MRLTRIIGVAILLSSSSILLAQTNTLTLDQAVQAALTQNLSVVQAQNNVEAADAGVTAAKGQYLPTLSANAGWNRTQIDQASGIKVVGGQPFLEPEAFGVTNYYTAGASLNYSLFDGFARQARIGAATSNAIATERTSVRTRQSIVFQSQSSYLNVLRVEQLVKVAEENLKRDQQQLERIQESNRVGALSIADVYRQQSQVAADEVLLINAQNNFDKARADLSALLGLNTMEDHRFADPSIATDLDTAQIRQETAQYSNVSELTQRALTARPDYTGATESYDAAQSQVTIAKSGYWPSIYAGVRYGVSDPELKYINNNKNLSWGINLNWNIFDAFQTNQSVQQAVAQKRNAEINLAQTQRNIAVDVKKALLDLDAARKSFTSAQKGLISASQDRQIAEERYNLGAGTLLDLQTANAALVQAQATKVNAVYDYITARLNVEYSVGERSY